MAGVLAAQAPRLAAVLQRRNGTTNAQGMNLPGWGLHPLEGRDLEGPYRRGRIAKDGLVRVMQTEAFLEPHARVAATMCRRRPESAMKLYIGNRNYSSWSMRPGVLVTQAGIEHEAVVIRFDAFSADSQFKRSVAAVGPTGRVPVLVDGGLVIWDTLAISEYVAEKFPALDLWPADAAARARARSVCAEMHSGFSALRGACPMNIEASLPETGALIWRDNAGVRADLARIFEMWTGLLDASGGPLLFGGFSIADAFYAPVCMRLFTYALPVPPAVRGYMECVRALPGVAAWITAALAERDFLDFEEPYRLRRA